MVAHRFASYCIVVYCIVQCYSSLNRIAFHCPALYCIGLYNMASCFFALVCGVSLNLLHCHVAQCIVFRWIALYLCFCIVLYFFVRSCTLLHHTVLLWFALYYVVCRLIVVYCIALYDIISCRIVLHHILPLLYRLISYYMVIIF